MSEIQIDPAFRIQLMDQLVTRLYASSITHRNNRLHKIIRDNSLFHKNDQDCFSFKREIFAHADRTGGYPSPMNTLSPNLRGKVREYMRDVELTEIEQAHVRGYFQKVVGVSSRAADFKALVPSVLHSIINQFNDKCEPGEGVLSPSEIEEFIRQNDKYLEMVRTRLTLNLINAP